MSGDTPAPVARDEALEVWHRRFEEAREAGFNIGDSHQFANSTTDVGQLRKLLQLGCPLDLIAKIILDDPESS